MGRWHAILPRPWGGVTAASSGGSGCCRTHSRGWPIACRGRPSTPWLGAHALGLWEVVPRREPRRARRVQARPSKAEERGSLPRDAPSAENPGGVREAGKPLRSLRVGTDALSLASDVKDARMMHCILRIRPIRVAELAPTGALVRTSRARPLFPAAPAHARALIDPRGGGGSAMGRLAGAAHAFERARDGFRRSRSWVACPVAFA